MLFKKIICKSINVFIPIALSIICYSYSILSYATPTSTIEPKAKVQSKLASDFLPSSTEIRDHTILTVETILSVYNKAKNGDADAQAELATGYETGSIGNLPNYKQALYWFEKSAKQKNGLALFSLYQLYSRGLGVARDQKKAVSYAELGIKLMLKRVNDEPDQNNLYYWRLGQASFWGVKNDSKWIVEQDFKKAFYYFNQAAQQGDFHSILKVIWMYKNGIGVAKNSDKAFKWSKYLASLDFPDAQYAAGVDYLEGSGTNKDIDQAIRYLDQAALSGYFPAISKLLGLAKSGKKTDLNIIPKSWLHNYSETWGKLQLNTSYMESVDSEL